ncbi:hypothetical protein FGB62_1g248 [Gracilaria domingensis]|nr:hypothetical protein FGB62_1g248 [Gracilaria domingensis]
MFRGDAPDEGLALTNAKAELRVRDTEGRDEAVVAREKGVQRLGVGEVIGRMRLQGRDENGAGDGGISVDRRGEDGKRVSLGVYEKVKRGGKAAGGQQLAEPVRQRGGGRQRRGDE